MSEDEEGGLMNIYSSSQEDRVFFIFLKPRVWDYRRHHLVCLGAQADRVCKEGGAVEDLLMGLNLRTRCSSDVVVLN